MGSARSYYHSRGFRGFVQLEEFAERAASLGFYLPRGIIWWVWSPLSGGCIRRTYFLSLIFLNQSIASLGHAGARRFIRRSGVKIGVAKGNVSLALLK